MLFSRLMKLFAAMPFRTFGQKIDDMASAVGYPIYRQAAIHKSQYFHPISHPNLIGIAADHLHGLLLTLRDTSRSHFDSVHIEVTEQHTSNDQFFVGQKTDT